MRKLFVFFGVMLLTAMLTSASEMTNATAAVHHFVDALNGGDANRMAAGCANETSVIDNFAPYYWGGVAACPTWVQAYDSWARQDSITNRVVTLRSQKIEVTDNQAYFLGWVDITWRQGGKEIKQPGRTLTVVLHKGESGWLITAMTWSQ
jgi:ketosteroid isomerase-like protein